MSATGRAALASALAVYAMIVLGALVRSTGSGLSCPDWPTCYGQWVLTPADFAALPDTGYSYVQVMLEWGHRAFAAFGLGPLILLTAWLGWRRGGGLRVAGLALVALLAVQASLGGVTVLDANSPWSVALHLGTALLLLSVLVGMLARADTSALADVPVSSRVLAPLAWGLALAAMVTAAITAKSGASLACATWPLCDGQLVPPLDHPAVRIHFAHRALAGATGLAVLTLWLSARHVGAVAPVARAALVLVVGQILLGGLVIWLAVPVWAGVLHQAMGVLVFALLAYVLARLLTAVRRTSASRAETDDLRLRHA